MRGYLCFIAIFSLLIEVVLVTKFNWLSLVLSLIFLIRLYFLKKNTLFLTSCMIGVLTIAFFYLYEGANQTFLSGGEKHAQLTVLPDTIRINGDQVQFYGELACDQTKKTEKVMAFYRLKNEAEQRYWQGIVSKLRLVVDGELIVPENNRNLGQFNYRRYLAQEKCHWILRISAQKESRLQQKNIGTISYRKKLFRFIDQRLPTKVASYLKALLFSERTELSEDVVKNLKALGVVHLLSISGVHLQFLLSRVNYFLVRLGFTLETTGYCLIVFVPIYGYFAGWTVSVFRAILMLLISLIAKKLRLKWSSLDSWSIVVLFAIWLNPNSVMTLGFQLSYLLSFVMILLNQNPLKKKQTPIIESIWISLVAMLVSVPVLVCHFNEFSWFSIFANIMLVPLVVHGLIPLLVVLLVGLFLIGHTLLYTGFISIVQFFLVTFERLIDEVSFRSFYLIVTGVPSFYLILITFSSLVVFFLAWESRKWTLTTSLLVLSSFLLLSLQPFLQPYGKVVIIDVGQGDSLLIKHPFNKGNYLIDTGGAVHFNQEKWKQKKDSNQKIAEKIVIPTLKAEGVSSLEKVIITHSDMDHMGALIDLAKEIKIKELVFPKGGTAKKAFKEIVHQLVKKEVKVTEALKGDVLFQTKTTYLKVVYPFEKGIGENNDSIVAYGKIGEFHWLFTGDLEKEGEEQLIAMYPSLKVDVLKIGHHGSNTSSHDPFLHQLNPKYGLISCGLNNRFKHPRPEVLQRLEKYKVNIYRTDKSGAIHYQFNKKGKNVGANVFETILK
ncbi:DNA internalization-related competence protein ComEC/Rec2 [Carnobacterium divergens]|uniref:DNA internalization-related competence protein ComEC/Rec2 n=1 Tax=Carnobacterium divergens TaxID=2748 RepID=UPI0007F49D0A|nr:DNA internalization-related competence protein ComEC/Rec2 [Carnobacterium divergens]SBO17535.1 DNA channel for uptake in competent cells [Carnobacterium divergens]